MATPRETKGMSGWSLAVLGLILLIIGVGLFMLDSAGIVNAHSYPALVISPLAAGLFLLILGIVMAIKGTRVQDDGKTRYGKPRRR